jgi:hypothetical protein
MGIGLVSDIKRIPSIRSYAAIFKFREAFNSALELPFLETLKRESTILRFPAELNNFFLYNFVYS